MSKLITIIKLPGLSMFKLLGSIVLSVLLVFLVVFIIFLFSEVREEIFLIIISVVIGLLLLLSLFIVLKRLPSVLKVYDDYLEFQIKTGNEKIYFKDIMKVSYREFSLAPEISLFDSDEPKDDRPFVDRQLVIEYLNKKQEINLIEANIKPLIDIFKKYKHIQIDLTDNEFGWPKEG